MEAELLTPDEFAIEAGISRKSAYNYIKEGRVRSQRHPMTGRLMIPASELERNISEVTVPVLERPSELEMGHPEQAPIVTEPASLKDFILQNIQQFHGEGARKTVESQWTPQVQGVLDFMTNTMKMEPRWDLLRGLIQNAPNATQLVNAPPLMWIPALLNQAAPVLTGTEAQEIRRRPMVDPEQASYTSQSDLAQAEVAMPKPPKVRRRQPPTLKVKQAPVGRVLQSQALSCEICNMDGGAHASGCPRQRAPGDVPGFEGGAHQPRVASPAAQAAQAKALAEKVSRERAGDFGIQSNFEECADPANCAYKHRQIKLAGRPDHITGHYLFEVEAQDAAMQTFRDMGVPSPGPQPPANIPEPPAPPLVTRKAGAGAKKVSRKRT